MQKIQQNNGKMLKDNDDTDDDNNTDMNMQYIINIYVNMGSSQNSFRF